MRIVISGGSNSMRKGGYADHLADASGGALEVVNVSLGAAPSLMGFFQQRCKGDLRAGDVLVLEYALNDLNHIAQKGYSSVDLLRSVELILRGCRDNGVRVLPVVMRPLPFETAPTTPRYHTRLYQLFAHYGLPYLDVSAIARASLGVPHLSAEHYDDVNHYSANGEVVRLVAQELAARLPDAAVPLHVPPLYCGADQVLEVCVDLHGDRAAFSNRAGSTMYYRPDSGPVTVSLESDAAVVGLVVLSGPRGGVLRVEAGDRSFLLSLTHDHREFDKLAIKMIGLENLLGAPLGLGEGQALTFSWSPVRDGALVDMGFRAPRRPGAAGQEGGVIGIVYEKGTRPLTAVAEEEEEEEDRLQSPASARPRRSSPGARAVIERATRAGTRGGAERRTREAEPGKVMIMDKQASAAGEEGREAIDVEGFLHLMETVQSFTNVVERTLRRVAPRITLAEYLALRALAARDQGESAPAARPAVVNRLVEGGYAAAKAGGSGQEVTEKGRRVLDEGAALIEAAVADIGRGDRPLGPAAARPLARATAALRRLNAAQNGQAAPAAEDAPAV